MVQSVAGHLANGALSNRRPFRAPHHSASMAALVGGGLNARPGEVSLAHHGVLFLDELPEFQPQVLDSLRQPLETGEILIARANHRATYPARFQLVAAMNPCRCGQAQEPGYACKRQPNERCMAQYQARLSGPLIDRIDLVIEVPSVTAADLILPAPAEGSAEVARPDRDGVALLREAADAMRLSARGFHRVLKVARTLADLDGEEHVRRLHLAEALSYRTYLDRRPSCKSWSRCGTASGGSPKARSGTAASSRRSSMWWFSATPRDASPSRT